MTKPLFEFNITEPNAKVTEPRLLLLSLSLISAGAIGYEILLMRLFSIIQWHHFAYMIISLALLGYGASGTFLALTGPWMQRNFAVAYLSNSALTGLTMVGCFTVAQHVPFNALEVLWNPRQPFYLMLLYLLLFIPFFCAANCVALLFMQYQMRIDRIYRSDLLGAGAGALSVILALFIFSPTVCLKLFGALGFVSASLAALDRDLDQPRWVALLMLALGLAALMMWPNAWTKLQVSEFKGLSQTLQVMDTEVIAERSSPLGLLTVVRSPTIPFRHAPGMSVQSPDEPPPQLGVFTDGDGLSPITRFDGTRESVGFLDQLSEALPYHLLKRPKVLVLGPGGGMDVLLARYYDAKLIDAVELNPQMVRLVQETYKEYAGNLYNEENVEIHIAEARGFVAGNRERYDLVQLSLLDSFSASSAGVYALSEGYLYTVNAFEEYLRHLTPGGILAITRWLMLPPRDSLKLFATARSALERLGVTDPGRRLVLIRSWNTATLLVKNGDFTLADLAALRTFCKERAFDLAYYPGITPSEANQHNILEEPYLFEGATALLGKDREDFLGRYKFTITPATDDRPYFSHFFKWRVLPELLALRGGGGFPFVEMGYLIVWATLLQAALFSFVVILLPLWTFRKRTVPHSTMQIGFYFLALGLAFLFVEIAFIQKFILFLSNPLYAIGVVVCAFLVFAGLGSGYSERFSKWCSNRRQSPIVLAVTGIILVALAYLFLLPPLFHRLMALVDPAKILIAVALIAPLAFCMGMPFPLGLKRVAARAPGFIPWAWGVNGCASVLSAVLATILAVHFGFTFVVLLALLLYLTAALTMYKPVL